MFYAVFSFRNYLYHFEMAHTPCGAEWTSDVQSFVNVKRVQIEHALVICANTFNSE